MIPYQKVVIHEWARGGDTSMSTSYPGREVLNLLPQCKRNPAKNSRGNEDSCEMNFHWMKIRLAEDVPGQLILRNTFQ